MDIKSKSMTTMQEKIQQLISEFSGLEDWTDRYTLLIEQGRNLPILPKEEKEEKYLINGCQSRVWIKAEKKEGKIYFKADSDAVITKGIAAILLRVFSGEDPKEVAVAPVDFLHQIGLKEHLSPTRSNGLDAMIKQIKLYAFALSLQK